MNDTDFFDRMYMYLYNILCKNDYVSFKRYIAILFIIEYWNGDLQAVVLKRT